ncbi:MAG: hypothetical protein ABI574_06460 [Burkholderiales bacterium]
MHAAPGSSPAAGDRFPLPGSRTPVLHPAVWHADQLSQSPLPGQPTGFEALDAELPGGGWPLGALTELLTTGPGQGELRLLAPALARLSQHRTVVWVGIAPPGLAAPSSMRPYAPALHGLGLNLRQLLWVSTPSLADAAWASEQALATPHCAAVVCWDQRNTFALTGCGAGPFGRPGEAQGHPGAWPATALRRLHLAAQASASLLFVVRPLAAAHSSPAPLRLACQPQADAPQRLAVRLLKRRGPPCSQPLMLDTQGQFAAPLAHRLGQPLPTPRVPTPRPAIAAGQALSAASNHAPPSTGPVALPASA